MATMLASGCSGDLECTEEQQFVDIEIVGVSADDLESVVLHQGQRTHDITAHCRGSDSITTCSGHDVVLSIHASVELRIATSAETFVRTFDLERVDCDLRPNPVRAELP